MRLVNKIMLAYCAILSIVALAFLVLLVLSIAYVEYRIHGGGH